MNHAVQIDTAPNHCVSSLFLRLRYNPGRRMAIMLEYTGFNYLATGTPATLVANPVRAKVRFIQVDFSRTGRPGFAVPGNPLPHLEKDRIDRPGTDAGQPGRVTGRRIQSKGLHPAAQAGLTDPGISVVSVFPLIHGSKRMPACNLLSKSLIVNQDTGRRYPWQWPASGWNTYCICSNNSTSSFPAMPFMSSFICQVNWTLTSCFRKK